MPVNIFFCYAHEDEDLLKKLKLQLNPLQRAGLINMWYDRDISAGVEWEQEIERYLNRAQIILLLVSPDFMNSEYCYSVEMERAIERHTRGDARVIPIILRPISWQEGPLGKLQALPTDVKPVTSWHNTDDAFFDIVQGIRKAVDHLATKSTIDRTVASQKARKKRVVEPLVAFERDSNQQSTFARTSSLIQDQLSSSSSLSSSFSVFYPTFRRKVDRKKDFP